jgi:hypothetical protein
LFDIQHSSLPPTSYGEPSPFPLREGEGKTKLQFFYLMRCSHTLNRLNELS